MSPILTIQRQLREIGRIRTGHTVVSNGKSRPSKLERFRLTSRSEEVIRSAAAVYGGTPRPWEDQWEVITDTDRLDIVIPPGVQFSQWMELWSGGGCIRRCDGVTELLADEPCGSASSKVETRSGVREIPPCPRDPAERRDLAAAGFACKPTTRLSVILPALPDLGSWRIESHGYYAAAELSGTVDVLQSADRLLPARLRLDQREVKKQGRPVNKFAVPVLELPDLRIVDLIEMDGARPRIPGRTDRRERVARPALPPGPDPTSEPFVPREGRRALPPPHEPALAAPAQTAPDEPPLPPEPNQSPAQTAPPGDGGDSAPSPPPALCEGFSATLGKCVREAHEGTNHRNKAGETWA